MQVHNIIPAYVRLFETTFSCTKQTSVQCDKIISWATAASYSSLIEIIRDFGPNLYAIRSAEDLRYTSAPSQTRYTAVAALMTKLFRPILYYYYHDLSSNLYSSQPNCAPSFDNIIIPLYRTRVHDIHQHHHKRRGEFFFH